MQICVDWATAQTINTCQADYYICRIPVAVCCSGLRTGLHDHAQSGACAVRVPLGREVEMVVST